MTSVKRGTIFFISEGEYDSYEVFALVLALEDFDVEFLQEEYRSHNPQANDRKNRYIIPQPEDFLKFLKSKNIVEFLPVREMQIYRPGSYYQQEGFALDFREEGHQESE